MKIKKYLKKFFVALISIVSIGVATNVVNAESKGFAYRAFRDASGNVKWRLNTSNDSINAGMFIAPDGTLAYCIEPLLHYLNINDGSYDINYDYSSFSSITGLNFDKIRELSLISFYGYGYNGDTSDENYVATQLEIWDAVDPGCCSVESGDTSLINDKRGTIRSLVNNEITRPSFDTVTKEVVATKEEVFTDTNNVLSGYAIDSCDNCTARIEGNNLIVKGTNMGEGKVNLKRTVGNDNQGDILYTSGSYQKLMSFGKPDPMQAHLKLNVRGGTLMVQKIDKDTKQIAIPSGEATLEGAEYEIFDESGNLVGSIFTDLEGKAIKELPLGKYTVKEKTPSVGYLLDENVYEFTINENNLNPYVESYEKVIDAYGVVMKEYGDDELGYKNEANAIFEVIDYMNRVVGKIFTDDEGLGVIKLPYGTYKLHQVEGTPNYKFVDDIEFKIDEVNKTYKFKLKNVSFPRLDITKVDSKSNKVIEGAKIDIYKYNIETNEFELYYEGITDNNGKLHIDNIELGKYYYIENTAPTGYLLDENKYYFEIDEYGKTYKLTLKNEKITGKLEFSKVDFSTSEPLPNTLIEIYNENDELVYSGRTDENGKIVIDNLEYGKYYILEKEAPEGYQLNPDKMWFEITEEGEIVKSEMKDEKVVVEVPDTRMEDFTTIYLMCLTVVGSGAILYGIYKIKKSKKK